LLNNEVLLLLVTKENTPKIDKTKERLRTD